MDDLIDHLQSKPERWSDVRMDGQPNQILATHKTHGSLRIVLLDPYAKFNIPSLPLPCCVAFSTQGDDPDSEVADYLANLRGPKRSAADESRYLLYYLVPEK